MTAKFQLIQFDLLNTVARIDTQATRQVVSERNEFRGLFTGRKWARLASG